MAQKLILKISSDCFSEIAMAMQKMGIQVGNGNILAATNIELEKGTELAQPLNWPEIKLRKDCLTEAAKVYSKLDPSAVDFIEFVEQCYNYVLNGKIPNTKSTGGW